MSFSSFFCRSCSSGSVRSGALSHASRAVSAECTSSVMNSSWFAQWSVRPRGRLLRSRAWCAPQRGVGSLPSSERPPSCVIAGSQPGCSRERAVIVSSTAVRQSKSSRRSCTSVRTDGLGTPGGRGRGGPLVFLLVFSGVMFRFVRLLSRWSCRAVLVGQVGRVLRVSRHGGDSAEDSSWPGVAPGGGASGLVGRRSW